MHRSGANALLGRRTAKTRKFTMRYDITFAECPKCKKKLLIERVINGTDHDLSIIVTCQGCVALRDEFRKEHPEKAEKIENWISS